MGHLCQYAWYERHTLLVELVGEAVVCERTYYRIARYYLAIAACSRVAIVCRYNICGEHMLYVWQLHNDPLCYLVSTMAQCLEWCRDIVITVTP